GKLIIVLDDLAQQAWQETQGEPAQGGDMVGGQLACQWRIGAKLFRFEFARLHWAQMRSRIGPPGTREGVKPMMEPMVGTRSVEPSARSCTTPSRTPGPSAIIQVVREAASPVRWC